MPFPVPVSLLSPSLPSPSTESSSPPPGLAGRPVFTGRTSHIIVPTLKDLKEAPPSKLKNEATVTTDVPPKLSTIEASKRLAAWTAVDRHVKEEHKVIGIGSGSTVPYVVERIVAQGREANKDRVFIPTGFQSKELIVKGNLLLGDVDQYPRIDVTLDGADEVDKDLNAIKGGGACHLREKVLAEAADTFIVVADYRKNSEVLGTTYTAGIPIEVAPFAYAKVLQNLHAIGSPNAALRMAQKKAGPVVSDNGNFIIDAPFPEEDMKDPYTLLTKLKMLTGVVEVGLFCHMAKAAYFGNQDGSVTVRWLDGRVEHVSKRASPLVPPEDNTDDEPSPMPDGPLEHSIGNSKGAPAVNGNGDKA